MTPQNTIRLTTAQALIKFLVAQHVERDGVVNRFFGGCLGIFGHGNVAGIGQALQEHPEFKFIPFRNEQAMVHAAVGYARMKNRMGALACTSSIGPGATNMVTGAALATIDRLPVLLLPGDIFADRRAGPLLQQLEWEQSQDVSVNDCFRPVSRYWDRINRPAQLPHALFRAMQVLTSPAQTGAVTLAIPQDVQAEAFDYPAGLFRDRTWHVHRQRPDRQAIARAVHLLAASKSPVIVAGGGVIYSGASRELEELAQATGIPVLLTQAGKGAIPDEHPLCLGGVGATGTSAANLLARDADLVLGLGTRFSDFTTASRTAFQSPELRFVNINVNEMDASKHAGLSILADAREAIREITQALGGMRVSDAHTRRIRDLRGAWHRERTRLTSDSGSSRISQAQLIGLLNSHMAPGDVIVNAAGSAPGDLHKLWMAREPGCYHVEYGYSCMGYEIPGGMGARMAAPERRVYVIIGDGGYLMMSGDLATCVQEGLDLTVLLVDNHGFASIGGLSRSLGSGGFGTSFRRRGPGGRLDGPHLPLDLEANAASLGAIATRVSTSAQLEQALHRARNTPGCTVIVVGVDPGKQVPSYHSWWDVPVAQVSGMEPVRQRRATYDQERLLQRQYESDTGP